MKVRKLQILCFYAQVWYLVLRGERFIDSDFQAWVHGPTSKKLYDRYKDWGQLVIPRMDYDHIITLTLTEQEKEWINVIYETYKDYSAENLEYLSKREIPYIKARNGLPEGKPCLNVISDESIVEYYKDFLNTKEEQQKGKNLRFPNQKNKKK